MPTRSPGGEQFEVFPDATFDTTVWPDPAGSDDAALQAELVDSLYIERMFGEAALDALAEAYCRSVLTVEEIAAYQAIAGVPASWARMPIPTDQVQPKSLRSAA